MNVHYILRTIYTLILIIIVCVTPAIFGCQKFIEQRKQYYYNKGMQLYNNRQYTAAAREFKKALQFDAKYFDALYMQGMCYYSSGNLSEALPSFQKASAERPDDIGLKLKIGECFIGIRGRGKGAYFVNVIKPLAIKDRDARILLLKYYLDQDDLEKAEETINHFLRNKESDPNFFILLVHFKLKKNNISEAKDIAFKHFSCTPDWLKTIEVVTRRLEKPGEYQELIEIYKTIIAQTENKLPYQQTLVKLYRQRRDEEYEEELLLSMLKDNPEKLEIKRQYIDFLKYYNRITQAEAFINDELKKQPQNIELQKILIETYMNTGQQQKAFAAVEKVLSALPVDDNRYVDFQNILAELNFRSGAVDKAKLIIKDILNKSQLNRDARFLLCRIFLREGDALSAVGELRRLVSENPTIAEFSYYLGIAHERRGEYILAEKAFRNALDVTPDYKDALVKWITIYPKEGSLSEVENRIKKYLELHPDDNEIRQMQDSIHATKSNMLSHLIISAGSKT